MRIGLLVLGICSIYVFACQPAGKAPQAEAMNDGRPKAGGDFLLVPEKRIGPLYATHSMENDLVQTFGVQNVKRQEIYLGEGATAPGFVLFPDTRNAVEIYYDSSIVKDRPAFLRISEKGTDWKSPEGVTIGTTLEELVKINGKAVTFWGFGWDYSGAVSNWNGGKMHPGLMLILEDTRPQSPESLLGDKEISSTTPGVDLKRIVVRTINVRL